MKKLFDYVRGLKISPWALVLLLFSASSVIYASNPITYPKYTIGSGDGSGNLATVDSSGNLKTTGTFTGTVTATIASNGANSAPAPTFSDQIGAVDGSGNLQPITTNSTATASKHALDNNILSILGTAPSTAGFLDIKGADGNVFVRQSTGSNLHTVVDSGSITANAGTNLNTSALALETGGNLATVASSVLSQGSTTSGQKGILTQGAVTTAAPTYTTGQSNPLSMTTSGALRVDATGSTQPVSGTVAVTQSTSPWVDNISQWGGSATTLGQKLSASSVPIVIASDDMVNTVSAQAARVTGTITTNTATVTTSVSQYSVATITASGTYAGITINFEASDDGGTTYYPVLGSLSSSTSSASSSFTPTANSSNMYNVTLPGITNFRVRSSAYSSGTMNIGITSTADPMVFNVAAGIVGTPTIQGQAASGASTVGNPVRTGANFNTTQPTVTTGQTVDLQATNRGGLIVSTGVDTFNATINAALPAGTNLLGKVGIDQTTPGTTNGTAIAQIGSTTVLTGGVNGSLGVGGLAANNASTSGNPVPASGLAESAEPTLATNGQNAELALDLAHKLIVIPFANKENFISGTATTTGTSDTSLVAASGSASLKDYITNISCANTGATTSLITFKNGSGGSTLWYTIVAAGGGSNMEISPPIATSGNTAFFFAAGSASTTIYCSATGFKGS